MFHQIKEERSTYCDRLIDGGANVGLRKKGMRILDESDSQVHFTEIEQHELPKKNIVSMCGRLTR